MSHHSFFLNSELYTDTTENIVQFILSIDEENKYYSDYIKNIAKFIDNYDFDNYEKKEHLQWLVYNYWHILFVYQKNMALRNPFQPSTFKNYFISANRMIEFLLFILDRNLFIEFFISSKQDEIVFHHFRKISSTLGIEHFAIIDENKKKVIVKNNKYESSITIQPPGDKKEIDFTFYFKLDDEYIEKIYDYEESKNSIHGRNPNGGKWARAEIQDYDTYHEKLLSVCGDDSIEENDISAQHDNKLEANNRKTKMMSIQLHDDSLDLEDTGIDFKKIKNMTLESRYKRFMVNRAIGRAIAKKNLTLKSDYHIPEVEVLRVFLESLAKRRSLEVNLILLSIILGINTKKIIDFLLGIDTDIVLTKKKSILQIKSIHKKDIFAASELDADIIRATQKKPSEVYLSDILVLMISESSRFINEKFIDNLQVGGIQKDIFNKILKYETSVPPLTILKKLHKEEDISKDEALIVQSIELMKSEISKDTQYFFSEQKKGFFKRITLTYEKIPHIFLHLFKIRKTGSDIGLLFTGAMQKNDEARVCYVATPSRLITYEKWQLELIKLLGLDEVLEEKYRIPLQISPYPISTEQYWIGSKHYINGAKFKIFLQKIDGLYFHSEIERLNAKMIFLQYALSCVMAARHFADSISVEQYSRREKVVLIQEKGKNLFSGKRIIPLNDTCVELIEYFLELKQHYELHRFSPSLVSYDKDGLIVESIMRRKAIAEWFKERITPENEEDIAYILKFSEKMPLNFGRHVFSSYASKSSKLNSRYIDAFLGHFKMGSEDQGIYSNFNNQEYMQDIRGMLDEIVRIYIPQEWSRYVG